MICSTRFTTYESTGEQLLPFLIVKNSGQGASIPNVKAMLSFMSSTLPVLSEETEKLIDKVGKLEKTQVAKESKRTAASKNKAPAKKKVKSLTSTDQVAKVIRRHIQPAEGDIFDEGLTLYEAVKDYEKRLILEALENSNWVKARAARLLRINRTTLVVQWPIYLTPLGYFLGIVKGMFFKGDGPGVAAASIYGINDSWFDCSWRGR